MDQQIVRRSCAARRGRAKSTEAEELRRAIGEAETGEGEAMSLEGARCRRRNSGTQQRVSLQRHSQRLARLNSLGKFGKMPLWKKLLWIAVTLLGLASLAV